MNTLKVKDIRVRNFAHPYIFKALYNNILYNKMTFQPIISVLRYSVTSVQKIF